MEDAVAVGAQIEFVGEVKISDVATCLPGKGAIFHVPVLVDEALSTNDTLQAFGPLIAFASAEFHGNVGVNGIGEFNNAVQFNSSIEMNDSVDLIGPIQLSGPVNLMINNPFVVHANGPDSPNKKFVPRFPLLTPVYDQATQNNGPQTLDLAEEMANQRVWIQKILKALVHLAHAVDEKNTDKAAMIVSAVLRDGFWPKEGQLDWFNEKDW